MLLALLLVLMSPSPFAQDVQQAYATQDAEALHGLLPQADSRMDSLLVRYRLYPLTEDESLLDDLPSGLQDGNARELALLSGLWSYRAGESNFFNVLRYGRRSTSLLRQAKAQAPNDPYVLLVEGQSLLFRPSIAGKDAEAAASRFKQLADQVDTVAGITSMEAHVWWWIALRERGHAEKANTLQNRLMSQNPSPLYRQFLEDPPDI